MTASQPTCEVRVEVTGAPSSGKSTLIAVLAQALSGAGHQTIVPEGTPTTAQALSDLTRPYVVTFAEPQPFTDDDTAFKLDLADNHVRAQARLVEMLQNRIAEQAATIEALEEKKAHLNSSLDEFRNRNIELLKRLQGMESRPGAMSPEQAAHMVDQALLHIQHAATIDADRNQVKREVEALRVKSSMMARESEARVREARTMLHTALTGEGPPKPARLSAQDRLAIANGADEAQLRAERAREDARAKTHDDAQGEPPAATLASCIEHGLNRTLAD